MESKDLRFLSTSTMLVMLSEAAKREPKDRHKRPNSDALKRRFRVIQRKSVILSRAVKRHSEGSLVPLVLNQRGCPISERAQRARCGRIKPVVLVFCFQPPPRAPILRSISRVGWEDQIPQPQLDSNRRRGKFTIAKLMTRNPARKAGCDRPTKCSWLFRSVYVCAGTAGMLPVCQ